MQDSPFSNLADIHSRQAQMQSEAEKELRELSVQRDTQETIVRVMQSLIEYLDNKVSKTIVVNQLKELSTPDSLEAGNKIVDSVEQLQQALALQNRQFRDEFIIAINEVVKEARAIPKDHKDIVIPEAKDYSQEFTALADHLQTLTEAVKAQETTVEAPVVNVEAPVVQVDAPDLKPLTKELDKSFKKAIDGIQMPQPTDLSNVVKHQKDTVKAIDKLRELMMELPLGGGGGGGGSSWVAINEEGTPIPIQLENGALPTTSGGASSFQVNDIEEGTTSYFGKTKSDGTYLIQKVTDTSVSYATVTNNGAVTTYTDAWTNKATLTYGRYDEAF